MHIFYLFLKTERYSKSARKKNKGNFYFEYKKIFNLIYKEALLILAKISSIISGSNSLGIS